MARQQQAHSSCAPCPAHRGFRGGGRDSAGAEEHAEGPRQAWRHMGQDLQDPHQWDPQTEQGFERWADEHPGAAGRRAEGWGGVSASLDHGPPPYILASCCLFGACLGLRHPLLPLPAPDAWARAACKSRQHATWHAVLTLSRAVPISGWLPRLPSRRKLSYNSCAKSSLFNVPPMRPLNLPALLTSHAGLPACSLAPGTPSSPAWAWPLTRPSRQQGRWAATLAPRQAGTCVLRQLGAAAADPCCCA
jgi:hypothetical protein